MVRKKSNRPSTTISNRLDECRRRLRSAGLRTLLISSEVDYFYLTGFTGADSAAIVTPNDVHIITDGRFLEEIAVEVPWARIWLRKGLLNDEIIRACSALRIKRIGVQPTRFTVGDQTEFHRAIRSMRIVSAPAIVEGMRKVKDRQELAAITKAIRVAEDAFHATIKSIRPGQSELEVAARIEFEMKCRGASAPAFNTICAEGPNAAVPHAVPGNRKLKKGSGLLIDWGARVGGYHSDLTRMVFIDSIPAKFREIYKIVLDAQLAAIEAIRPGARMCDVDAVAREMISKAGYGKAFTHGLGHGLGLKVHEAPSLSWRSKEALEPGMVVTVEPGVYLSGVAGVRIEDDVLVTTKGHRVLTRLSKSIDDALLQL